MLFDIGSNIGKWSLANIERCNKIIAVEASPITFTKLLEECGNHPKIECINYAVCDNDGNDITFYHAESDTISTLNKDWLTSENSRFHNYPYREIVCKTITIDDLIQKYGEPELIKIDVEGGEYECIKSLKTKSQNLCFEWASETNDITIKCLNYLNNLGFTSYYLQYEDDYGFRPTIENYTTIDSIKEELQKTTPKNEWEMIWCK
jgi:FkbM family methyltransferase